MSVEGVIRRLQPSDTLDRVEVVIERIEDVFDNLIVSSITVRLGTNGHDGRHRAEYTRLAFASRLRVAAVSSAIAAVSSGFDS